MARLLIRRLRDLVIVLILVGTAMFFIIRLVPGQPATAMLGPYATQDQIDALTKAMHLDGPLILQYFGWITNAATGDLGTSITFSQPVTKVIIDHAVPTIFMAVASTIMSVALAVPLALKAAAKPRSLWARLLSPVTAFGLALPSFWLALMLVLFLGVFVEIFPVSGYVDLLSHPIEGLRYLVLPIVVLMSHQLALFVATLRESISGELLNLYLRTGRAKGVKERTLLYRHVLPNALLPTITVAGASFGHLLGGAIVLEMVFVIPGWGLTLYNGIQARDYPLILGLTLTIAVLFVIVNLIADLLYIVADPKVRVR
ncbi:peptide/nickel transport system permease protein [Antricoccus suffuscus]|uniref:Peptide/nickel transport system permease protein n=1 Tax=Antricoccus suffuscus TaxID=1629062 RepID=A0A2T1A2J2_9ACTN|nr:ABC transporter permease [Antricoccus suffuscus]PRZ42822.1 peptide/nickel transport system permease protein [Antricoccus suffuscus]